MAGSRSIRTRAPHVFQDTPVALTALEFDILRTLLARPGFVFTRELILDAAYAGNIHVADRTIDSHVRNIRAKMAAAGCEFRDRDRPRRRLQTGTLRGVALTDASRPASGRGRSGGPASASWFFSCSPACLSLPLFSLYFLKVYQNQLIQQTEAELIAQSAALSAVFHREVETGNSARRSARHQGAAAAARSLGEPVSTDLAARWNSPTRACCRRGRKRATPPRRPIPPSSRSARA